jgi:peptide/nickel transport system substrate-binding protein
MAIGFFRLLLIFLISSGMAFCILPARNLEARPIEMQWAVEMEIASVDPTKSTNNWERTIGLNVYDILIFPDPDPKKKLKPWIANSWTVSPDGKTYSFQLKKGLKFHDGSEITAEDVAFSMERLVTMAGPIATVFKEIKPGSTKVIDKYTVALSPMTPDRDPTGWRH